MPKEIISVNVKVNKVEAIKARVDLLAVAVTTNGTKTGLCQELDKKLKGKIAALDKLGDFKGKKDTTAVIYTDERIAAKRVLLIGLGDKKDITADTIRKAAAMAAGKAVALRAKTVALALHQGVVSRKLDLQTLGQAITEGAVFGGYRYDEYQEKTKDGRRKELSVQLIDAGAAAVRELRKGFNTGNIIGQAQAFARTIANRPGNVINPVSLAKIAKKTATATPHLSCTVLDEKQLKQKKFGGILAVGAGSVNKPRLIVLKYTPPAGSKKTATLGLVGKAITFDSGGISLKPGAGMQDMKFDKSGGIAVLGAMKAIAELKPNVKVYGIIPAAENMPSGTSYRPGDIITTLSGKTVEIQNTDAEGRMILCDAIHYAVKLKCDPIVDIATLTGACMVALGKYKAGLMGSDDRLIKKLQKASAQSGEAVWHLPCGDEYTKEMKSKIADLKNTGSRWGGASTAASFLKEFTGDTKWAHIDMAGVDMFDAAEKFGSVGSTGFGVRLLTMYILNAASKTK
ncbi:MAG TPA: leucyl aminopeptidase [Phycisphaerales bacterium]|nr:leucyl aminopeptidase [Phycisphaerales bacterium]